MWDEKIDNLETQAQYVEWEDCYEVKSFIIEVLELIREISSAIQKPQ
jgi:hypothetical protein